jgi:hypothetical protein
MVLAVSSAILTVEVPSEFKLKVTPGIMSAILFEARVIVPIPVTVTEAFVAAFSS